MTLWSGRFEGEPGRDMQLFSESLSVDLKMFEEDVAASKVHAQMLEESRLLSAAEGKAIRDGLEQVLEELRDGRYRPGVDREDIHMAVEARLIELIGEVGGKLHTARSRNDQVATDVRLWLRSRLQGMDQAVVRLIGTLLDRVERDGRVVIPGFTHLQRGQPIWLGHHLLAHAWALSRDIERLAGARRRVNRSPLGAGAMAGTPHPIDRARSARLLNFDGLVENAMDAVAARDHLIESVASCCILMTNLSRMAEELVLWSAPEFGLVRMGEAYTTGSSIMPQKRNPDAAELVRGKSARVCGDLQALLVLVKGLPMAYNRDLQEDRGLLFDAVETTLQCVDITAGMWSTLQIQGERYEAELKGDFLLATELADYLAAKGVPFRDAHHISGRLVRWCEERGGNFTLLTLDVLRQHHSAFDKDALRCLDLKTAIERRHSRGGTAWEQITRQVEMLRTFISRK